MTDGLTELLYQYRASALPCILTCDKKLRDKVK